MFSTTFLGHQGWLLSANQTHILVDPILCEWMGDGDRPWVEMYPPRVLDTAAFPPISAVLFTHEHPDHFHVPSLNRLDRRIPLWFSARSSNGCRAIARELGFEIRSLPFGGRLTIGDFEIITLHSDGRTRADEWDVVPFIARDRGGDGSFFTTIDLSLTPALVAEARAVQARPTVWTLPNNDMGMSYFYSWLPREKDQAPERGSAWADEHQKYFRAWAAPELLLVNGGGYTIPGELGWLNRQVFNCSSEQAAAAMHARLPGVRIEAALPGGRWTFEGGRLIRAEPSTPFLRTADRSAWPAHDALGAASECPDLPSPCSGRTDLAADERTELPRALNEFARFLYGRDVFEELGRLGVNDVAGKRSTFAVWARTDASGGRALFAYDAAGCAFVEEAADGDPRGRFVAGVECWATDLLDALELRRSPGYAVFGRMRYWNAIPGRLRFDLELELFLFGHPLRRPEVFLDFYRRQRERLTPEEKPVPAAVR